MCGDDDGDDAGLSSDTGTNLKVGDTCKARTAGKFFLSYPSTFLALQLQSVVLVSASVWSVQFDHLLVFCSSCSQCPRAHAVICTSMGTCAPSIESALLSCYSFTPESIIKQQFNMNACVTRTIFSQCLRSKLRTQ